MILMFTSLTINSTSTPNHLQSSGIMSAGNLIPLTQMKINYVMGMVEEAGVMSKQPTLTTQNQVNFELLHI